MCLAAAPCQTNHTGVITKSKEEECLMFLSARALRTKLDTFRAFPGPAQIGSFDNYYNGRRPLVKLNYKMAAGLWPPFCRAGLRRRVLLVLLKPERCGCGFAQRCVVCIVLTRSGSACDERPRTERLSTGEAACMQQRRNESVQGESRREEYGVERVRLFVRCATESARAS